MKAARFFFAVICCSFSTPVLSGQGGAGDAWQSHLDFISATHPSLPLEKLDSITVCLDSTALADHCFQFIWNPDKTRFIAFYLTERNSASYAAVRQDYGGVYRSYTLGADRGDRVEVFAYSVAGMWYSGKWYYDLLTYVSFYADSEAEAKKVFLIRDLNDMGFFRHDQPATDNRFWKRGPFSPVDETDVKVLDCAGRKAIPEVVDYAIRSQRKREGIKADRRLEGLACKVFHCLWNDLHTRDSVRYHHRYTSTFKDDPCSVLYNSGRDRVLMPFITYDQNNQAYLEYFFLRLSEKGNQLFTWQQFPVRPVEGEVGREGKAVIQDIQSFIPNWGWGTVNMISKQTFWEDEFSDRDLVPVSYQSCIP